MIVYIFILGLIIGSFLNVLIDRLPLGQSVVKGRSHCDHCKRKLNWYELIPVISFILQKGKSRCCHRKLSFQYPMIELVTAIGLIFIYSYNFPNFSFFENNTITQFQHPFVYSFIRLLDYSIIFSALLVIFVSDLKTQIIPDSMIIVGTIASVVSIIINYQLSIPTLGWTALDGINQLFIIHYLLPYFLSAIGASTFFFLLWLVTHGRGMGFGDVKLVFFLGLLCGYPGIIYVLYIAFLTGAIVGVILIISHNKTLKSKIAFGPFLVLGSYVALQWSRILELIWKSIL